MLMSPKPQWIAEDRMDNNNAAEHGNTLVGTLRKIYGAGFGSKFKDTDKLSDVLHKLDAASLSQLHKDHEGGHLDRKIKSHL
jgi:hypothetical protein